MELQITRDQKYKLFCEEKKGYLYLKVMDAFERTLSGISDENIWEKFFGGRIKYGGEFMPETIRHEIESKSEVVDFWHYVAMEEFLRWEDDPASFDEFVSQYMQ